eukprot:1154809-Prymnesium_polylepis.3
MHHPWPRPAHGPPYVAASIPNMAGRGSRARGELKRAAAHRRAQRLQHAPNRRSDVFIHLLLLLERGGAHRHLLGDARRGHRRAHLWLCARLRRRQRQACRGWWHGRRSPRLSSRARRGVASPSTPCTTRRPQSMGVCRRRSPAAHPARLPQECRGCCTGDL